MNIWFATGNAHKKAELAAILGADIITPFDIGLNFAPEETATDFCGNALLKARELYRLLTDWRPPEFSAGDPVIADDSGLCVDALGGRPGIYSARYAGPGAGAAERNALLLAEMSGEANRSARFVCAMAALFSPERFFIAQETVEGEIVAGAECSKGGGGFGYDPIFLLPGLGRTMAELAGDEKNRVSHRGKAARAIAAFLKNIA